MTMDTVMWADAAVADWLAAGLPYSAFEALVRDGLTDGKTPQDVIQAAAGMAADARARAASKAEAKGAWADPLPFGANTPPEIPPSLAPEPLASFISSLAVALQVPQSACMIAALCSVAAVMAKKAVVEAGADWTEPLNLYGAMVLPPGERKSAILSACRAPLDDWEADAVRAFGERFASLSAEKRILEARARAAEKRASVKNDPAIRDEAVRLAREAAAFHVAATPQVFVDDITTERIVGVMQDQGGKIALFSDEGGIFDIMAGLYASGALKIDAYLKAYDGKAIRVDRVGRASEVVLEPALTMCLGVQPAVIQALGQNTAMRGRGLLGRVLYVLPESMLGRRLTNPPAMPASVKAAYRRVILALADLEPPMPNERRVIRLSREASELFTRFRQDLEPMLATDADLGAITDWAGKLAGGVVRIAALWHSIEMASAHSESWRYPIGEEAMSRAISLGKLLQAHAKAAFGLMKADGIKATATAILEWLARKKPRTFTRRDAYRALARHVTRADEIEAPLELLEERGFVRQTSVNGVNGVSTRALTAYEPHPSVVSRVVSAVNAAGYTSGKVSTNIEYDKNGYLWGAVDRSKNTPTDQAAIGSRASVDSALTALTALTAEKNTERGISDGLGDFDFDDTGADREVWQ